MTTDLAPLVAPEDAFLSHWTAALARGLDPSRPALAAPVVKVSAAMLHGAVAYAGDPDRLRGLERRLGDEARACVRAALWQRDPYGDCDAEAANVAARVGARAAGRLAAAGDRLAAATEAAAQLWVDGLVAEAARSLAAVLPPPGSGPVAHRDYSVALQRAALALPANDALPRPLLDLGCGASGALVAAMRADGVAAVGIDRERADGAPPFIQRASWMDFPYAPGSWGTVVSHMAFSLHFLRHHHQDQAQAAAYARVFMAVLGSLAPGGLFAFVPSLPFFTRLIPTDAFSVATRCLPEALAHHRHLAPLSGPVAAAFGQATHVRRRPLPA